jgi:hypothetical protein
VSKRFLFTIATLVIILGAAGVAILLAKGYTFSPQDKLMKGTGLISVTSLPDQASVYLNGHLTSATNTTISQLTPGNYSLKVTKEGFIPWEKNIDVKEGLVSEIKVTLFPALPTIYPLTYNGVVGPVISSDNQKLVFAVPTNNDARSRQKGGVWVWTMSSQPISFNRGSEPHQVVASTSSLDFSKATLKFSPDSKSVLVTLQENDQPGDASTRNYLLPVDKLTSVSELRDITPQLTSTLQEWETDQQDKDNANLLAIKDLKVRQVASNSADLHWSPDETKLIVSSGKKVAATPSPKIASASAKTQKSSESTTSVTLKGYKVYDIETGKDYNLPEALAYYWLPDSRHIVLVDDNKISICEFDGSNTATVYAGSFDGLSVFPWPDSSRLVIVTSFNTPTASTPNFFGINLK